MKQKFYPQVNHLLDSYVHSNVILFEGNCDKEEIRVKGLRIALRSGQAVWWTTKICILPKPGVNPNRIPFIPYNHDLDSWSPGTLSLLPGHGFPSGASSFSALQLHKSWGLGFCCCSVAQSCLTLWAAKTDVLKLPSNLDTVWELSYKHFAAHTSGVSN